MSSLQSYQLSRVPTERSRSSLPLSEHRARLKTEMDYVGSPLLLLWLQSLPPRSRGDASPARCTAARVARCSRRGAVPVRPGTRRRCRCPEPGGPCRAAPRSPPGPGRAPGWQAGPPAGAAGRLPGRSTALAARRPPPPAKPGWRGRLLAARPPLGLGPGPAPPLPLFSPLSFGAGPRRHPRAEPGSLVSLACLSPPLHHHDGKLR